MGARSQISARWYGEKPRKIVVQTLSVSLTMAEVLSYLKLWADKAKWPPKVG